MPLIYFLMRSHAHLHEAFADYREDLLQSTDTYLSRIRDPLRYIIIPMLEPRFVAQIEETVIWYYRDRFYGNLQRFRSNRLRPDTGDSDIECRTPDEIRTRGRTNWTRYHRRDCVMFAKYE